MELYDWQVKAAELLLGDKPKDYVVTDEDRKQIWKLGRELWMKEQTKH